MVSLQKPTIDGIGKHLFFDFKMRVYGMKVENFVESFSFLLYNIGNTSVGGMSNEVS